MPFTPGFEKTLALWAVPCAGEEEEDGVMGAHEVRLHLPR